jgi:4a-hydroxytetrahydrobiopterin dehydratase
VDHTYDKKRKGSMADKMTAKEVEAAVAALPGWTAEGDLAIAKTFKLADHIAAMGFVVRIAMAAEVMDHHPELRIVYNTIDVRLNTHSAGGVTKKDVQLAQKIEALQG